MHVLNQTYQTQLIYLIQEWIHCLCAHQSSENVSFVTEKTSST